MMTDTMMGDNIPQHDHTMMGNNTLQHDHAETDNTHAETDNTHAETDNTPQHDHTMMGDNTPQHDHTMMGDNTPQHDHTMMGNNTLQHDHSETDNTHAETDNTHAETDNTPQHDHTMMGDNTPQHDHTMMGDNTPQHDQAETDNTPQHDQDEMMALAVRACVEFRVDIETVLNTYKVPRDALMEIIDEQHRESSIQTSCSDFIDLKRKLEEEIDVFVHQRKFKKPRPYNLEDMKSAVRESVLYFGKHISKIAEEHNMPRGTLSDILDKIPSYISKKRLRNHEKELTKKKKCNVDYFRIH
ncbi:uncharacterized protein [Musca autumnalis]|uniref:uncharacterized protein n=1 Tax=Musca autumnalis TaxID=221902 RepID=UPI003CEE061B